MRLDAVFEKISQITIHGNRETVITGITAHSKNVAPGNLFVARKGASSHGNAFIEEAIAAGAVAVLTDLYNPFLQVAQVVHPDPGSIIPEVGAAFYENPSEKQFVVGITGTNGKTTTAYLISHLLDPCGLISTIEYKVGRLHLPARLTTPDLLTTQKMLGESVRAGQRATVMEVSSHALEQGRTKGIHFSAAVFTNLSQDHLDYHGNMDAYFAAKMRLFTGLSTKAVVNIDDPRGKEVVAGTPAEAVTFGLGPEAQIRATDITSTEKGLSFCAPFQVDVPLVGEYNIYNVLAAIGVAKISGISDAVIAERLATFPPIPGRMQPVPNDLGLQIYIDFAHTPDALQRALESLRPLASRELCVVFGCGGDRDQDKRAQMGFAAHSVADKVIVTSDNPRTEDPIAICRAIGGDRIILDRREAIAAAIEEASPGDLILIAGRGHESEQIIGSSRIPFLDFAVAQEICASKRVQV